MFTTQLRCNNYIVRIKYLKPTTTNTPNVGYLDTYIMDQLTLNVIWSALVVFFFHPFSYKSPGATEFKLKLLYIYTSRILCITMKYLFVSIYRQKIESYVQMSYHCYIIVTEIAAVIHKSNAS